VTRPRAPAGRLVVVATPIGNLEDLSPRAEKALRGADLICCEDTRRTGRLLERAGIAGRRLLSLHAHNEAGRTSAVLGELAAGATVALVSDAGTPLVCDPGERLVAAAIAAGLPVVAVPGPSALLAALVASGFSAVPFAFEGFLPRRGPARRARLAEIAAARRTTVLYEAPQRLRATLADLAEACGPDRRVAICRELTKLHEEVRRSSLAEAAAEAAASEARGEHVLVLEPAAAPVAADALALRDALARLREAGLARRDAVAAAAALLGVAHRDAYAAALELEAAAASGVSPGGTPEAGHYAGGPWRGATSRRRRSTT